LLAGAVANNYFGHVLIAVRQGWQRRDAAVASEEALGRYAAGQSKYYQLYVHSIKLNLAAVYLRRVRCGGRSFAAALAHVSVVVTPSAPAAHNLGVGLQQPSRGKMCGGVLGEMVRALPKRGPPRSDKRPYFRLHVIF
jgi:hypothetical protein